MILGIDSNGNPISVGKIIKTADGSNIPVKSPVTINAGEDITLKVPNNAVEIYISPSQKIQISEKDDFSQYYWSHPSL